MSRGGTPVGNVEALVEAREGVDVDHHHLDGEVEAVVAYFGLEPRRVLDGFDVEVCHGAEDGAGGEEGGSEQ